MKRRQFIRVGSYGAAGAAVAVGGGAKKNKAGGC